MVAPLSPLNPPPSVIPRPAVATPAFLGIVGLVVGGLVGMFMGTLVGSGVGRPAALRELPRVFAVTSQLDGSFAVCTAPIDTGVEGFFMIDFETGDLSGGALGQATGKFAGAFKHNVLKDLGFKPGQAKNPRFMLVSGLADLSRRRGGSLGQSVLYVTYSSTGVTAAYGVPWGPQQAQAATPFVSELELLDIARPRGGGPKAP